MKSGKGGETAYQYIRNRSDHIEEDVILEEEMSNMSSIVFESGFISAVEKKTGKLN